MEFTVERDTTLEHHGILGQKWGVRRYQNEDGSLTEAGKKHAEKAYQKHARRVARGKELDDQRTSIKDIKKSTALKDLGIFVAGSTATSILSAIGFTLDMPVASAISNLGGTATIAGMAYVTSKGIQDAKALRTYYAEQKK